MGTIIKNEKPVVGLSGYGLKMIAVITMLIDHTAATVLEQMLSVMPSWGPITVTNWYSWYRLYMVLRGIGRMAFPIYCFLLVEGLIYTRSRLKYAIRMFVFALISEIPFDMALNGCVLNWSYNNVFFTLFLGLLTIAATDYVMVHMADGANEGINPKLLRFLRIVLLLVIVLAGCILAEVVFRSDYGASGILTIYILYVFRNQRMAGFAIAISVLGVLSSSLEFLALLMLVPMYFYNGTRGKQCKYFFYAFYPVHLLILALICRAMGLGI